MDRVSGMKAVWGSVSQGFYCIINTFMAGSPTLTLWCLTSHFPLLSSKLVIYVSIVHDTYGVSRNSVTYVLGNSIRQEKAAKFSQVSCEIQQRSIDRLEGSRTTADRN